MFIFYYSTCSPFPALLAAISHCHPAISLGQAWAQALRWQRANSPLGKEALLIERFGRTSERDTVYLMSAAVPQPLLLRTLNSLAGLMKDRCGKELFLPAGPLPLWSGADGNAGVRPKEAFWKEIKALVEQTRLRVELIKKR